MTTAEPPGRQTIPVRSQDFERLAEPLRRELKVHCYRMMGSVHDAEDLVQETYLRAWRSADRFEGGSFRAWLYRIATNACLNALESRKSAQRLLPDQLGPPVAAMTVSAPATDVAWLGPFPDRDLTQIADESANPEVRYSSQESVRLAFVAAIQKLPPRQRAALLLCDVLGWSAAETATLLGGSPVSVNSALQRARATLGERYPQRSSSAAPTDAPQTELLARYLKAWEAHDVDGFVALLKDDATLTMPPWPQWFVGRTAVRDFFAQAWKTCGGLRLVPTSANRQSAFAVYEYAQAQGAWAAHSIHVLSLENDSIAALTMFLEPPLFHAFGLAATLDEPPPPHSVGERRR
jgi:RNA polymerase sigma-70 factor, ECF subfamily